jgi:hypothetical protein
MTSDPPFGCYGAPKGVGSRRGAPEPADSLHQRDPAAPPSVGDFHHQNPKCSPHHGLHSLFCNFIVIKSIQKLRSFDRGGRRPPTRPLPLLRIEIGTKYIPIFTLHQYVIEEIIADRLEFEIRKSVGNFPRNKRKMGRFSRKSDLGRKRVESLLLARGRARF